MNTPIILGVDPGKTGALAALDAATGHLIWVGGQQPRRGADVFVALLQLETDQCIIWPLGTNNYGYGRVSINGRRFATHVGACQHHHGAAPTPAHEVAHSCVKTRACMNYRHLRWATRAENVADKQRDGTQPLGQQVGSSKLTERSVRTIRHRYADGERLVDLANEFNVSYWAANDCVRRNTWAWLDATEEAA